MKIEINEKRMAGSDFVFFGVTDVKCQIPEYEYTVAKGAFYIEENYITDFLSNFLYKHFDGSMPINFNRPFLFEYCDEFIWNLDENFYEIKQIENMIDEISLCADALSNNYDKAIKLDFASRFSIFNMTDNKEEWEYEPREEAIKRNIGTVIDFYRRFVERMKLLIVSDPHIKYIVVCGP